MTSRREFLQKSVLAGIGISLLGKSALRAADDSENASNTALIDEKYTLPALPYSYKALEPFIDERTMEIHHSKHHQAYVDNLNKALDAEKAANPGSGNGIISLADQYPPSPNPEEAQGDAPLLPGLEERFKTISTAAVAIRNNGGGHWNHSFFWEIMKMPGKDPAANAPSGKLMDDIKNTFGDFEKFKTQFGQAAKDRFGSGWTWLIKKDGALMITSTPNQDNPLMDVAEVQGTPLLGLDVWEHAYYLKYVNVRADYINNWWNLVNWERVEKNYSRG